MDNICAIYKITNKINGKIYIGQTWQTINRRFNAHCNRKKYRSIITNAIQKYGKANFIIEHIASSKSQEDADYLETYFIETFDSINQGYNIKEGGSCGKHHESTKSKLSELHRGKHLSEETKEKIRIGNLGKVISEETREKLGRVWKGRKRTTENKKSVSEGRISSLILQKKKEELIGYQFGHLTVIGLCAREENGKKYKSRYLCFCACGNEVKILGQALKAGQIYCGRECPLSKNK